MVTVEVPAGVPGLWVAFELPPPPPQDVIPAVRAKSATSVNDERRCFPAAKPPTSSTAAAGSPKMPLVARQYALNPLAGGVAVEAAVVIVSVVEPAPVRVMGLNKQVASAGNPELQLKLTARAKPFAALTFMVYTAGCPA